MVIYKYHESGLEGSFVETAFTNEEIRQTIAAERKLGLDRAECAFLGSDPVSTGSAVLPTNAGSAVKKRNDHLLLDDRKLWISQAVLDAADLKTIRAKSLANLTRWRSQGTWGPVYDEWWQIMTNASDATLIYLMTSQGDEPNRLRQSMPYTGILDEEAIRKIRIQYYAAVAKNDE